jgi:hypothetical protein
VPASGGGGGMIGLRTVPASGGDGIALGVRVVGASGLAVSGAGRPESAAPFSVAFDLVSPASGPEPSAVSASGGTTGDFSCGDTSGALSVT